MDKKNLNEFSQMNNKMGGGEKVVRGLKFSHEIQTIDLEVTVF